MSAIVSALTTSHLPASSTIPDPDRLAPEDAYYNARKRGSRDKDRSRSANGNGRRSKANYKKLLWFKQPFPDNYTDEATFLDHLQRNPRLQPYEFWSLMADSTVIVQHIASVAIFCCAFVGIYSKGVAPVSVVSWASFFTVLGWALWDYWVGQEEAEAAKTAALEEASAAIGYYPSGYHGPYVDSTSSLSPRNQQRLATAKSALLIYASLLGLSPILKSLTKSTTEDSIWAMSTWLLCINVAFFDYGGGTGAHLPASISTNSALMASTVLASRLPSTTHVFSLTLFSIEVFGLFPIFRRQLRTISWRGHLTLTIILVILACGGVFVTLTGGGRGAWIAGVILGGSATFVAMGGCCWWLIGLQKYKNEIHGPWDPARPVIRRRWD
ncbi:phosphatidylinositol N-acetylglucosaminyltransferas-like protein subunit C [Clohesyomyces aquaticus]|uniref:Phosphatidylinositol N-acetylglucosaminyltransferas-like protein subunit C n=1 Tax=Clohesyomyces aquaticus TaxID=1231657 RepID=A0A1Y1Z5F5_9PLEO|nr:phosphatidylinositol N-acetylglucosaminyltransferas-like protein subunit C [Clohesyomyces aquaticus]